MLVEKCKQKTSGIISIPEPPQQRQTKSRPDIWSVNVPKCRRQLNPSPQGVTPAGGPVSTNRIFPGHGHSAAEEKADQQLMGARQVKGRLCLVWLGFVFCVGVFV